MQNFQKLIKLPQLFLFLLGNAFVAYSYQGFVSANDFLSGGIYGISGIITNFFSFIPFSLVVLLLNIPCMLWAWRELDKRFVILTTVALLLQVVFLQMFEGVVIYNNDLLLAAIFAGVFVGAGDALVLRSGSGSSGVHLIAMVMRQKFGISVSTVTTCINTVIILLSTGIFGIEKGLYTLILIFASGQVVHAILDGLSSKRTAFIITAKGDEVGAALIEGLNRGVTKLQAEGLYTHTPVSLLMCVTNMLEVGRLKTLVQSVDPQAFITFYETTDFRGHFLKHNILVDKDEDAETASMAAPPKRPNRQKPQIADLPEKPELLEKLEKNSRADKSERTESEPANAVPFVNTSRFQLTINPNSVQSAPEGDVETNIETNIEVNIGAREPDGQLTAEQEPEAAAFEEILTSGEVAAREPAASVEEEVPRLRQVSRYNEPHEQSGPARPARRQNSVITGGVTRPERRTFVPPAPPGTIHSKSRSNRDFWGEDSDNK